MKLTKSQIKEVIRETIEEDNTEPWMDRLKNKKTWGRNPTNTGDDTGTKWKTPKPHTIKRVKGPEAPKPPRDKPKPEFHPRPTEDVEEGITGALAGSLLAKRRGGPGQPDFGVEDIIKMAAGGYFGHKIQQMLTPKKKEDAEEK